MEYDQEGNDCTPSLDEFLASLGGQSNKIGSLKLSLPCITTTAKKRGGIVSKTFRNSENLNHQENATQHVQPHSCQTSSLPFGIRKTLEPIKLNQRNFMSASKLKRSTSTPEMDVKYAPRSSTKVNVQAYRKVEFTAHKENRSKLHPNISSALSKLPRQPPLSSQKVCATYASSKDVTDLMKEFPLIEHSTRSNSLNNLLAAPSHHKVSFDCNAKSEDSRRSSQVQRSRSLKLTDCNIEPKHISSETKNCSELPSKKEFSSDNALGNNNLSVLKNIGNAQIISINSKSYLQCRKLGAGGSSVVHQVMDLENFQEKAVKIVHFDDDDTSVVESYRNEVQILKKLQYSPRVIKLYDHEETHSDMKLVMEIGSIDLASLLSNSRKKNVAPLSDFTIKHYWHEMLLSVQVIHKEGVIHSDLKPANFLLVKGMLKLIDFGISSSIQQDMTSVFKDCQAGTWNYMSPESLNDIYSGPIINGKVQDKPIIKIGVKSDVWSLGCILYNFVYGKTPFQDLMKPLQKLAAISNSNTKIEFPPLSDENLLDVLERCLEFNTRERPSIEELLEHPYLASPVTVVKKDDRRRIFNEPYAINKHRSSDKLRHLS